MPKAKGQISFCLSVFICLNLTVGVKSAQFKMAAVARRPYLGGLYYEGHPVISGGKNNNFDKDNSDDDDIIIIIIL